jgi:PAS domain S-box-containing protein
VPPSVANLDALPFPLLAANSEGKVLHANSQWLRLFQLSSEQCFQWQHLFDQEVLQQWTGAFEGARKNEASFQFEVNLGVENEVKRYLLTAEPQLDQAEAQWLVLATKIDEVCEKIIVDYEQDSVALRMAGQRWYSFFHDSATGKAIIGLNGQMIAVNPQLCVLFGYGEEELLRLPPRQLRHPEDCDRIDDVYQSLLDGGPPVLGVLGRYITRDGRDAHLMGSFSLVRNSAGHPLYFAVEMQDDTARLAAEDALQVKMRESAQLNNELERSNADLRRFAYVASHDLQEPLRKIRIFGGRLEKALEKSDIAENSRDYLVRMLSSAARMQQLIADLLEFSRPRSPMKLEAVDLTELARDAASDFETSLEAAGGRIDIEELPTIPGESSRLRQMFCNLIGNALKFHGEEPALVQISAQSVFKAESDSPSGEAGQWWEIRIRDNGIGFDESDLPRVLEVFGRLHPRDRFSGTGIGLAICRKVAQEHGGDLSATSAPGQGTTFIVSLPYIG